MTLCVRNLLENYMKVVGATSEMSKIKLKNKMNLKLPFIFQLSDVTVAVTSCVASHMGLEASYSSSLFSL